MNGMRLAKWVGISAVVLVAVAVALGTLLSSAFGADADEPGGKEPGNAATGVVAMAIAVSVASGALGAGYAVGKVGSAALGAASERPEIMGRALVFVVVAEGIAVWGLVGAILLVGKL